MSDVHGRPTALDLVDALREHIANPPPPPTRAFHDRVAANVASMVARELERGTAPRQEHAQRLAGLGCSDDAELARRIRAEQLDDDTLAAMRDVVLAAVLEKLAVANPGYPAGPPAGLEPISDR